MSPEPLSRPLTLCALHSFSVLGVVWRACFLNNPLVKNEEGNNMQLDMEVQSSEGEKVPTE
jgi:hypothetical protein